MNGASDKLRMIELKLCRASEHIHEVRRELEQYAATKPTAAAIRRNPETRRLEYYVERIAPVPPRVSVCIGDALHNMRAALDHLAYQLVLLGGGAPSNRTQFPICDSEVIYHKAKKKQLLGASPEAIKLVDATRPYKEGTRALWVLHKLNNIDKHRLLLTAAAGVTGIDLGAFIVADAQKRDPDFGNFDPLQFSAFFKEVVAQPHDSNRELGLVDYGEIAVVGKVVLDVPAERDPTPLQIKCEVVVHEPEAISATPAMALIEYLHMVTHQTVRSFEPVLSDKTLA